MSKSYTWSSAGISFTSPGPASVEEYNQQAATPDNPEPCLGDAVDNVIFRSHIPSFWDAVLDDVEKMTGMPRSVDEAATNRARERSKNPDKVGNVLEKFSKYVPRVLASEHASAVTSFLQKRANEIGIDLSPGRRSSGVGSQNLAKADEILSRDEAGVNAAVSKLMTLVDGFELLRDEEGRPDRQSLAGLIKAALATV